MKANVKKIIYRYSSLILLFLFILIASIFAENFFTVRNLTNVVRQSCVLGLLTVGMSFVLICGHMDLSIGSIMTFTGLIAISFGTRMPAGAAIACALLVGILCGAVNGLIITLTHANSGESLMITFGTQLLFSAVSLLYTGGFSLSGSESDFYNALGTGSIGKWLPVPVLIYIVFAVLLWVLESKTSFGRQMHMIGFNPVCSHLSGVHTGLVKMVCYCISGFCAAAGAIILTSRTLGATPTAGVGYEMDAIAAVIVGGTSMSGGKGSIVGTVLGMLIIGVMNNLLTLFGVPPFLREACKGVIVIVAVLLQKKEADA